MRAGGGATESTVLGPFYVPDSPWRDNGDAITDDLGTDPLLVTGHVRDTHGRAACGRRRRRLAERGQPSLRGAGRAPVTRQPARPVPRRRDGAFAFRTVRPVDYPIPDDGPVGRMLTATGRHPWRPAHVHMIVSAAGMHAA